MRPINLLKEDPIAFLLLVVPLLYSIIIHELAHGWVAYKMGDPRQNGLADSVLIREDISTP